MDAVMRHFGLKIVVSGFCLFSILIPAICSRTKTQNNTRVCFALSTVFHRLFYVRRSSTHWTINSGNWLVGVGMAIMVELHTLISLATNPQRNCQKLTAETWGLLPTSACAEMPFQSLCSSMSLLMSLAAHSGGRSGFFLNSQQTVLYCNFLGDWHMLCFNHGARIFNVPED